MSRTRNADGIGVIFSFLVVDGRRVGLARDLGGSSFIACGSLVVIADTGDPEVNAIRARAALRAATGNP